MRIYVLFIILAIAATCCGQRKADGKLIPSVTLKNSQLASTRAGYDPDKVPENWYALQIAADKLPDFEVNPRGRLIIAVLDGGIDYTHDAFKKNLWVAHTAPTANDEDYIPTTKIGWDFVNHDELPTDTLPDSHGTHVAGLASGRWLGTLLPAFQWQKIDDSLVLLILKVADDSGNVSSIESAIQFAAKRGARVIAGSWTLASDTAVASSIRSYKDVLFVLAAGNGTEPDNTGQEIDAHHPIFPASFNIYSPLGLANLIAVGASDPEDHPAYFSNYGAQAVTIFAPGVKIMSTVKNTSTTHAQYGELSGTSQATPLVAFTAALIRSRLGDLSAEEVKLRIINTADFIKSLDEKGMSGRLNLAKAVAVDEDVVELANHSLKFGTIQNDTIDFALGTNGGCNTSARKSFYVQDDRVIRVIRGPGILFEQGQRIVGELCDQVIKFKTTEGADLNLRPSDFTDLIWAVEHK